MLLSQGDFQEEDSVLALRGCEQNHPARKERGCGAENRPQQYRVLSNRFEESKRPESQDEDEREAESLQRRKAHWAGCAGR